MHPVVRMQRIVLAIVLVRMNRNRWREALLLTQFESFGVTVTVESKQNWKNRQSHKEVCMCGMSAQQWPSTQITLFERTRHSAWLDADTTRVDKKRVNSCALKHLLFWGSSATKKYTPKLRKWFLRGYVHGYGYPAYVHKVRTDQWWWSVYTSAHQSLSLIDIEHAAWLFLSFSLYYGEFRNNEKIPSSKTRNLSRKIYGKRQLKIARLRPAPSPCRAALLSRWVLSVWLQWYWIIITVHIVSTRY